MNERARNDYESIYDRAADAELMARFMRGELQPAEKPKAEIPVVHSLPRDAMTSAEAKERLGVSAARVSKLISSGKLEAVSYCGRKYVTPEVNSRVPCNRQEAGKAEGILAGPGHVRQVPRRGGGPRPQGKYRPRTGTLAAMEPKRADATAKTPHPQRGPPMEPSRLGRTQK